MSDDRDDGLAVARDEARIHVGTHGWVTYLTGKPIPITVVDMVIGDDAKLYAKCDDGSGDCRWFLPRDIHQSERAAALERDDDDTESEQEGGGDGA